MAKFERSAFSYSGGYLMYQMNDGTRQFIARFKSSIQKKDKPAFLTFLIKNFSVEEYIERLENRGEAPLVILRSKGHVSFAEKKAAQYKMLAASFRSQPIAA